MQVLRGLLSSGKLGDAVAPFSLDMKSHPCQTSSAAAQPTVRSD